MLNDFFWQQQQLQEEKLENKESATGCRQFQNLIEIKFFPL